LILKAPGYRSKSVTVIPSKDGDVSAILSPATAPGQKRPGGPHPVDDLEF
jgi:hypothetical protein